MLSHAYDFLRTKLPVTAFCSAKHPWEREDDINDRDIVIFKVMIFQRGFIIIVLNHLEGVR